MAKLNYNKEKLLKEYSTTFNLVIKVLFIGIGSAILYFFIFILYLGGVSHTPHQPAHEQFKDRFILEYDGKKLPIYNE